MHQYRRQLVIFVKQPILGRVKTRLGADIGLAAATSWYRTTLKRLTREVGTDPRWTTYLAIDPDNAVSFFRQWIEVSGLILVPQGPGGLGSRMQRIFERLPPGPVQIIGSDVPAIKPTHIAAGFKALGEADTVFGPSEDGGYWLIGQKRLRPQPEIFRNIRWSTPNALKDTIANCRGPTATVDTLRDIDNGSDLFVH